MKIRDFLVIIILLGAGAFAYYAFVMNYLSSNLDYGLISIIEKPVLDATGKGKTATDLNSCSLECYKMDCKMTRYLEQNLAWVNNEKGIDLCSYVELGRIGNKYYLKVLCQEFYVSSIEIICPDDATFQKCYNGKEKNCSGCTNKAIKPRVVEGSGISVPVILTEGGNGYTLWTPRNGSFYDDDVKEKFPSDIIEKLSNEKTDLESINIERAEKHFDAKVIFDSKKVMDNTCERSIDCPAVPGEYVLLSNCIHKMKCIDKKCNVGCYDLFENARIEQ